MAILFDVHSYTHIYIHTYAKICFSYRITSWYRYKPTSLYVVFDERYRPSFILQQYIVSKQTIGYYIEVVRRSKKKKSDQQ